MYISYQPQKERACQLISIMGMNLYPVVHFVSRSIKRPFLLMLFNPLRCIQPAASDFISQAIRRK